MSDKTDDFSAWFYSSGANSEKEKVIEDAAKSAVDKRAWDEAAILLSSYLLGSAGRGGE